MALDIRQIKSNSYEEQPLGKPRKDYLGFLNKEISFGRAKLGDTKKERFYNQLGALFSSGIDLGSALQIIIEDESSQKHKKVFEAIFKDVIGGQSFSEALNSTGQFTDYEYYSIKVGEESGRLIEVLKELDRYFELRLQQKRQLSGALSYPIIVMLVAITAVIFMLNVVVPMFSGVFQRFGGELPPLTQKVLNLSNWFSDNLLYLILFLASVLFFIFFLRRYTWYKKYAGKLALRLPFAGKLIRKLLHARFCHSVSLLSLAQVPLLDALAMVREMIPFYPMKEAIGEIRTFIEKGKHMHEGMVNQRIFDRHLVSITKVGEEVNQIGELYSKLYDQYTAEVKHMTAVMGNLLEPFMIIFVGILVMIILIAMYLPLFQLSTTVF